MKQAVLPLINIDVLREILRSETDSDDEPVVTRNSHIWRAAGRKGSTFGTGDINSNNSVSSDDAVSETETP